MIDLRNKNVYVGNQEVLKGYLGNNLLFNTLDLVFPEPPTIPDIYLLRQAYFFGSGEIINYYSLGSDVFEGVYAGVIKENGLYLEEPINFHDFTSPGGSVTLDMTLERPNDIIDSLQPGESVILIESKLTRGNTLSVFVGKDSDGFVRVGAKTSRQIYSYDINAAVPIGDAEYIHITYSNSGSSSGTSYSYYSQVNINGVEAIRSSGSTRTGKQTFDYANISGGILLYDLKIYSRRLLPNDFNTFATDLYNSIKDLTFVKTDQL